MRAATMQEILRAVLKGVIILWSLLLKGSTLSIPLMDCLRLIFSTSDLMTTAAYLRVQVTNDVLAAVRVMYYNCI